jgi:hypothetical protein
MPVYIAPTPTLDEQLAALAPEHQEVVWALLDRVNGLVKRAVDTPPAPRRRGRRGPNETVLHVIATVEQIWKLEPRAVTRKARTSEVLCARCQTIAYLHSLGYSCTQIGQALGQDRSTVAHQFPMHTLRMQGQLRVVSHADYVARYHTLVKRLQPEQYAALSTRTPAPKTN